jgi:hypothetical protein
MLSVTVLVLRYEQHSPTTGCLLTLTVGTANGVLNNINANTSAKSLFTDYINSL